MAVPTLTPSGYIQRESGLLLPSTLFAADFGGRTNTETPDPWLVDWVQSRRSHAGLRVSPQGSMSLAAYYACLNVIAQDCAKLPLPIYEELDRGRQKRRDHRLWTILQRRFNADMTAYMGRWVMTHHAVGWGNGYGIILRDASMMRTDGEIMGIYPIHPSRVWPERNRETGELVYRITRGLAQRDPRDVPLTVAAADIIHLKGPSPDGLIGYSVCEFAAESLGLSLAAQEYGAAFFGNSAIPSGILRHPKTMSEPAQDRFKKSWYERHGGPGRSQGVAVLEEGMEWQSTSIPPDQAQFLQTRQFQIPEVARWFRMQLHKIADLSNAHFTNIEQQNIDHLSDTMLPWLTMWEQELEMKLLADEPGLFIRHDVRALMRADSKARSDYYRALFMVGALSPNDIRELEDQNPYEGGNEYYLQVQYVPVRKRAGDSPLLPRPQSPGLTPALAVRNGEGRYADSHSPHE